MLPVVKKYFKAGKAPEELKGMDVVFPVELVPVGGRAVLDVYSDSMAVLKKVLDGTKRLVLDLQPSKEHLIAYIGLRFAGKTLLFLNYFQLFTYDDRIVM